MCIYFKDAFSMIKKIFTLTAVLMLTASSLSGQGFFSVSAGTDGFNMNFGAYQPMRSLLLVPHRHEYNPLLLVPVETPRHYYYDDDDDDDYYYDDVVVYPAHHSIKYYKKAAKRYRKALKHARKHAGSSWGVMLTPNGIMIGGSSGPAYYYDDDIEDFYEDMYEHHHKKYHKKKHHRDKHYKHYKKKHHHHDDDPFF